MELVNHILLTESFLAKGHLRTGGKRLTNYLNSLTKPFVSIRKRRQAQVHSHCRLSR